MNPLFSTWPIVNAEEMLEGMGVAFETLPSDVPLTKNCQLSPVRVTAKCFHSWVATGALSGDVMNTAGPLPLLLIWKPRLPSEM